MEVPGAKDAKSWVCLYEFFGTALLIYSINACQSGASVSTDVGLTLFACILLFGDVSGGHFNPAVSIAVFIKEGSEKMGENFGFMVMLWLSQVLGATFGVMLASISMQNDNILMLCPPVENSRTNGEGDLLCAPANNTIGFNMLIAEIMGTFTLASVILIVKYNTASTSGTLKAFAVGVSLTVGVLMIGGISGGCMNPAVGFVQTIFQDAYIDTRTLAGGTIQRPGYGTMWCYLLGPIFGGMLAGLMSKLDESARSALTQKPISSRYGSDEERRLMGNN